MLIKLDSAVDHIKHTVGGLSHDFDEKSGINVAIGTYLFHGDKTHVIVETHPAPIRRVLVTADLLECDLPFGQHSIIRFR